MYSFKNTIIFTGAGFTANFGGFVAKEMWSKIFNNPKLNNAPKIKQELKDSFDFEKIYSRILQNALAFKEEEVKAFEKALNEAYEVMDNDIKQPNWFDRAGIYPQDFTKFLSFFTDYEANNVGSYFTLNQDLFPERHFNWTPLGFHQVLYKNNETAPEMMLPDDNDINRFRLECKDKFLYVKLHGSTNWISDKGDNIKVIGINKKETIEKISLLNWYFDIFKAAIYRQNVKLLIIGYSFQDEHINDCLLTAIRDYQLKLYVVTPTSPDDFHFSMNFKYPRTAMMNEQDERKKVIWDAIEGYFPYKVSDIFAPSFGISAKKAELYKSLEISF